MGEFFGSLYCWLFEDFFGLDLANYLWGEATEAQQTNMYIGIGLTMLGISLFVMVLYYYIVNHPKLCNLWGWGIFLFINAGINFLVGWQWTLNHLYSGKMVTIDPVSKQVIPLEIYGSNTVAFGISNAIISIVAFIIFTYAFKWWSTNCWVAPENTFTKR